MSSRPLVSSFPSLFPPSLSPDHQSDTGLHHSPEVNANVNAPWNLGWLERFHFHFSLSCIGEGNGNPLQCSCLENLRDSGTWWAAVYGVAQSWTRLNNFTFTFHFHALEWRTHSSVLAWRIPGTGEPGGLPSMGSHRVGHY